MGTGTLRRWVIGASWGCMFGVASGPAPLMAQPNVPTPNPGFSIVGHIDTLTRDAAGGLLGGGRVRVNGLEVTLPRNLLITMPGQTLTLKDIFDLNPAGAASGQSGLALSDAVKPRVPFEIALLGNVVDGQYIAGWAKLTQQELNVGAGFIQHIDHAQGVLWVGADRIPIGTPPTLSPGSVRVVINDPKGAYGLRNDRKLGLPVQLDERFAADPDNSAIHAETGFPMCVPEPANTPAARCLDSNRPPPGDPAVNRFTCAVPGGPQIDATSNAPVRPCNPNRSIPLRVGDYITYTGNLLFDPANNPWVAAYAISASVGAYTVARTNPAYIFIEEVRFGVGGQPFDDVMQEETSIVKVVGFSTDPSRTVELSALHYRAGQSEPQPRRLMVIAPSRTLAQTGRFRSDQRLAAFLPPTRDVRAEITGVVGTRNLNGIWTGKFEAPVSEYIAPEATRFGQTIPARAGSQFKTFQVPVPFQNFCFLSKGGDPLNTRERDGSIKVGALSPFPKSGHDRSQVLITGGARLCGD